MNCPRCNGFVTDHYDDRVCVNCGWRDLPADVALPIVTIGNSVSRVEVNLDPANPVHNKRMKQMLTRCEGSGKAGYKYKHRNAAGKARCRVCDRVFTVKATVVRDHKPTRLMLEQLGYALAINERKPNQPPFSLSL